MGWKTWANIRSIAEKEGRVVGVLESSDTPDSGLIAMTQENYARALHAERALTEEVSRLEAELVQLRACKMGIGGGSGQLFVYGDYDSVKAVQKIVLERDNLLAQLTNKSPIHSNFAQSKSPKWYPEPDKLWLASCPDNGLEFYATEQEALDAGANFIEGYIGDDGWGEAVDQVFVAEVKYITRQTNVVKRPADGQIDDDGFDEDGNDWSGDHDCRCNYELKAVTEKNANLDKYNHIKEVLHQAIMVVAFREGDVSTEDGIYATTCTDSIIRLESALCEALGTKHDGIDLSEALGLLEQLMPVLSDFCEGTGCVNCNEVGKQRDGLLSKSDAAIGRLLEGDQPLPPHEQSSYFLKNPDDFCGGDNCDVCGGAGVFQGRKCDGIPF